MNDVFDCLVLSGGGAKGAYGAGVAKALFGYYRFKDLYPRLCFIGTSAGALNACILATDGPDRLIEFWLRATNKKILGARIRNPKFQGVFNYLTRSGPFSVYQNSALRSLINESVKFEILKDKHLIIAVTDYTRGELRAFYISHVVDKFVKYDSGLAAKKRRLSHLIRIENRGTLTLALLASAAIPVFFPPVKIGTSWYIDGGVGNHTPTREAAYFLRHLEELKEGVAGEVYCIKQDPPRIVTEKRRGFALWDILKRTLEVYHYVHMEPIIRGWHRINYEVQEHSKKVDSFLRELDALEIPDHVRGEIAGRVRGELGRLGGATERRDFPLIEIEPSSSLGDTIDFNAKGIRQNIERGYMDMIDTLRSKEKIDHMEHTQLSNLRIFPGGD